MTPLPPCPAHPRLQMAYASSRLVCAHETHAADGTQAQAITCPRCLKTSWNLNDVREGYCGSCRDWTSSPLTPTRGDRS